MTIGWNTTKTASGYTATVARIAHQSPTQILKSATFATRAQAVTFAKKWTLYFRRTQVAA